MCSQYSAAEFPQRGDKRPASSPRAGAVRDLSRSTASSGGISGRGERRNRFGSRAGVALQGPQAGVAALGHEQR
jgi:hypothetical protein